VSKQPRAPSPTALAGGKESCATEPPLAPLSAQADYLTPDDVAALLKVSRKSVLRWARDDATMPVLHIGGTVRFPRERLLRWLRDREQGIARARQAGKQVHGAAQPAEVVSIASASSASCADPCADGGAHRGGAA
jgi:excisionase family DNA binding protein